MERRDSKALLEHRERVREAERAAAERLLAGRRVSETFEKRGTAALAREARLGALLVSLGVPPATFEADDIEATYRKALRMFHPDRHRGDVVAEERFKLLQSAHRAWEKLASAGLLPDSVVVVPKKRERARRETSASATLAAETETGGSRSHGQTRRTDCAPTFSGGETGAEKNLRGRGVASRETARPAARQETPMPHSGAARRVLRDADDDADTESDAEGNDRIAMGDTGTDTDTSTDVPEDAKLFASREQPTPQAAAARGTRVPPRAGHRPPPFALGPPWILIMGVATAATAVLVAFISKENDDDARVAS